MIFDVLYFLSVCFCFITSLVLFFKVNTSRLLSIDLLGFFFLLNGISAFFYLLITYKLILYIPFLYKIPAPLTFLIAPLAYLYVRSALNGEQKFRKYDWLHLVPFVVFLFNYLPFYLMPYDQKYSIVQGIVADFSLTYTRQDGPLPEWTNVFSRTILSLLYIVLIGLYLHKYYKKTPPMTSTLFKKIKKWLYVFFYSLTGYTISLIFVYVVLGFGIVSLEVSVIREIVNIIIASFFFILSIYLLINPEVLLGLSQVDFTKSKETKSIKKLAAIIVSHVEKNQSFLNPNCSASQLAKELDVSHRNLSLAIDELNYKNFNDYINYQRLNFFLDLADEEDLSKYDIVGLASKAGFNSKPTFYRVFKERMKMTPNDYLNQIAIKKAPK